MFVMEMNEIIEEHWIIPQTAYIALSFNIFMINRQLTDLETTIEQLKSAYTWNIVKTLSNKKLLVIQTPMR